jgi:hypothetical protein
VVAVDAALLVEGLLADITHLCVGEVLVGLQLQSRHVLDVGYCMGRELPCWMWTGSPMSTDLPRMLRSRVSAWEGGYLR